MKSLVLSILVLVPALHITVAETFAEWDKKLPQLPLTNVTLSAGSLTKTLNNIAQHLGIRMIAYITSDINKPFAFRSQKCSVSDVLDQVASTYGSMEWNQDKKTGVIWFVPKNGEAETWLNFPVKLKRPQPGLRMYTDIIDGLSVFTNRKIGTPRRGISFLNMFDYTVDLPAGVLTLREIINICASSDPHISFWLQPRADYSGYLVISLGGTWSTAETKGIVPIFRHFWELEIGQSSSAMLKPEAMFAALGSPNPHTRAAAEQTLCVLGSMVSYDDILKTPGPDEQRMWVANGLLNAIVKDPKLATYHFALEMMQLDDNQRRLLTLDDPALAVLTAAQIARCGKGNELLTKLLEKQILSGRLSHAKSGLFRMARESEGIRNAIKGKRPNWTDLTTAELDQCVSPDELVFSAP